MDYSYKLKIKARRVLYKLIPRSLVTRFTLLIALPIIIAQFSSIYIFYTRHWQNISYQTSKNIANQISYITEFIDKNNIEQATKACDYFGYKLSIHSEILSSKKLPSQRQEILALKNVLSRKLQNLEKIEFYPKNLNNINIWLKTNKGFVKIVIPSKPLINPSSQVFVLWIVSVSVLVLIIALIYSKNQIRSIIELSNAANSYGRDKIGFDDGFKPSGAYEIRQVGIAFMKMRDRIKRNITKRTQMLAMISHDLRTPLTRIILQLELMDENNEVSELKKDVSSMKHMIDSYLDFARGEEAEKFIEINIQEWLNEFFEDNAFKHLVTNIDKKTVNSKVKLKPLAFKRALTNLIINSEKYANKAIISLEIFDSCVKITLEDDGEGIENSEKKSVLKPFYRVDKSRKIDSYGSVGLGLPIANEIIYSHNGKLELLDSEILGGLKIIITLPKSD